MDTVRSTDCKIDGPDVPPEPVGLPGIWSRDPELIDVLNDPQAVMLEFARSGDPVTPGNIKGDRVAVSERFVPKDLPEECAKVARANASPLALLGGPDRVNQPPVRPA